MTFLSKDVQRELASTLKPCPFCKSEDLYVYRIIGRDLLQLRREDGGLRLA